MPKNCSVPNCNNRFYKEIKRSFHRFPAQTELRQKWVRALRRKDYIPTPYSYLCSDHFTPDCFSEACSGSSLLKKNAVPSIFDFSGLKVNSSTKEKKCSLTQTKRVLASKVFTMTGCSAIGCRNSQRDKKNPKITYHCFPKDKLQRGKWVLAVRRKNWEPSASSCLCSEHFSEDMIDRTSCFRTRLNDDAVPNLLMGYQKICSVANCISKNQSNGKPPHTFPFPKDATRRKEWIRAIRRKNFTPGDKSMVCAQHFDEGEILMVKKGSDADGSPVTDEVPMLVDDAVPHIFPNRQKPATRIEESDVQNEEDSHEQQENNNGQNGEFSKSAAEDSVRDYYALTTFISDKLDKGLNLNVSYGPESVVIYKLDVSEKPVITAALKVHQDLTVQIWQGDSEIAISMFSSILGKESKLDQWDKFQSLTCHLSLIG